MTLFRSTLRAAVLAAALSTGAVFSAHAQEVTQSHLDAALDAVTSAKTSRGFDNVLPLLSQQTQNRLIRLRPDQHTVIADVVEAQVLTLVARRRDLDNDVARIWAKHFTEQELKDIAAFYKSEAGKKLADIGPRVVGETLQSVKGWSDRVGEELYEKSLAALKEKGVEF
ncbi:DUF2059 domain-containing protein [Prosthecomicrobium pneumaticum]|uniref:DUF2059 domain-containing protein n=1 Tax=Prosthecomicrobium pneumaticum TaxID=81895 RepID=A0A7W9CSY7_9HYPH|nr:DUF2059 domain-containing protein [Prosthecomicrobium pneumaticum]MBB5751074.1 hypothetical protein [Prosthecomicrobium pneumaticum]